MATNDKFLTDNLLAFKKITLSILVIVGDKWISEWGSNVNFNSSDYLSFGIKYSESDNWKTKKIAVSYPNWRGMINAFKEMDERMIPETDVGSENPTSSIFYVSREQAIQEEREWHESDPDSKGFNEDAVEYGYYLNSKAKIDVDVYTKFYAANGKVLGMHPSLFVSHDAEGREEDAIPGVRFLMSDEEGSEIQCDIPLEEYYAISDLVQSINLYMASRSLIGVYAAHKSKPAYTSSKKSVRGKKPPVRREGARPKIMKRKSNDDEETS